ncbi:MAG TPA: division/cell wall cluster transcriptional repressor MraZ [Candidatus Paceibacterota bacterium]
MSFSGIKWDIEKTNMLIGEYLHTLDNKKRISLPAKFRKEVGRKVVVTRGLDSCLFMYPQKAWEKIAAKVSDLPVGQADTRGMSRFLLAGAVEVEVDSAGRILIPDFLKDFADLKTRVVLAGVSDRIEIWNEKTWEEYKRRIEKSADQMAQTLGDLGIL